MDGEWGKSSPLNSVTKLSAIHNKTKGRVNYSAWVVMMVRDRILSGQSSLQDGWSEALLTGERDRSNKGIIDLYMYKYDMKFYLLGPLLEMHAFQSEAKDMLRAIFKDHRTYREKMRPLPEEEADLSFMASWRKSTERLATMVEHFVFEARDDGLLKVAMKARKTPGDFFMAYDSAKEKMDAVLAEIAKETAEQARQPDTEAQTAEARGMGLAADIAVDPITADLQARGLEEEDVKAYRLKATRAVKSYIKLVSIAGLSEAQVKEIISDSVPGKAAATTLLYDSKLAGEPRTAPHIRLPPFSEQHGTVCVGAFTSSRSSPGHVGPGDMVLFLDGMKKGLSSSAITRTFLDENNTKVKNVQTQIMLVYNEGNLVSRRRATRTMEGLRQVETLNVFTTRPLNLPYRKRLHYTDCSLDNLSPVIGTIAFEKWSDSWTLTYKDKKHLFGDFLICVGGPGDAEPDDGCFSSSLTEPRGSRMEGGMGDWTVVASDPLGVVASDPLGVVASDPLGVVAYPEGERVMARFAEVRERERERARESESQKVLVWSFAGAWHGDHPGGQASRPGAAGCEAGEAREPHPRGHEHRASLHAQSVPQVARGTHPHSLHPCHGGRDPWQWSCSCRLHLQAHPLLGFVLHGQPQRAPHATLDPPHAQGDGDGGFCHVRARHGQGGDAGSGGAEAVGGG